MNARVQIEREGSITLPDEFRQQYGLNEGDVFSLIDLGDGSFLLSRRISQVERAGNEVAKRVEEAGLSLDDLLEALDDERERYYREHYAQG